MIDLEWAHSDLDVEHAINGLIKLLSPMGLSNFLGLEIGPYLQKRAQNRFEEEGDDVTGPWAPLQPYTVQVRESEKYPMVTGEHPINVRTTELENWVTGSGWIAVPHALGSTLHYPKKPPTGELRQKVETAQKGRAKPATVPRPVLGVNETDMLFFITALHANIEEAMR